MIDLYSWPTPNGNKIHLMLEELELNYNIIPINIGNDEQFSPNFLDINPNNKIPAIVDHDGPNNSPLTLFESGAILHYLAQKTGKFLGNTPVTLQWLMFQMGGVGPMFGQLNHFVRFAKEDVPYGKKRYLEESKRICRVMDEQLGKTPYIAGDDYTIADMAIWPWVHVLDKAGIDVRNYANLNRWHESINKRPATQRALDWDTLVQKHKQAA